MSQNLPAQPAAPTPDQVFFENATAAILHYAGNPGSIPQQVQLDLAGEFLVTTPGDPQMESLLVDLETILGGIFVWFPSLQSHRNLQYHPMALRCIMARTHNAPAPPPARFAFENNLHPAVARLRNFHRLSPAPPPNESRFRRALEVNTRNDLVYRRLDFIKYKCAFCGYEVTDRSDFQLHHRNNGRPGFTVVIANPLDEMRYYAIDDAGNPHMGYIVDASGIAIHTNSNRNKAACPVAVKAPKN